MQADIGLARPIRARSSAVEHYLDTVGVTGSIPVAPTIQFLLRPRAQSEIYLRLDRRIAAKGPGGET
jgi:hypothetical protein